MKASFQVPGGAWSRRGYTLVELLCSISIVLILAALALPGLRNGYAKGKRLYCVNNLHQTGFGYQSFAHDHHDRYPTEVSTNDGGVLELVQAANSMTGAFYFSYKYFLPLSNELSTPKVLNCPADTRHAATNFAGFQNDNLSYFAAGTPEYGSPSSPLAGNRNVFPAFGSIARVGTYRRLMWTEELHHYAGNVLFADGHVKQLDGMFAITNAGVAAASLHMPTLDPSSSPGAPGQQAEACQPVSGGFTIPRSGAPRLQVYTNRFGTNATLGNWVVSAGHSANRFVGGPEPETGPAAAPPEYPVPGKPQLPLAVPARPEPAPEPVAPWSMKSIYQKVAANAPILASQAAAAVYETPWYLLLFVLALLFELQRRIRARHRRETAIAQSVNRSHL